MACAGAESPRAASTEYSIEWVCENHGDRVRALMADIDLNRPGLERVGEAAPAERWPEACRKLLEWYRDGDSGSWLRHGPARKLVAADPRADEALSGRLPFQGKDLAEVATQHKQASAPELRFLAPHLPAGVIRSKA